jgi:uncharacterized protein YndB with AHSA1/START domain
VIPLVVVAAILAHPPATAASTGWTAQPEVQRRLAAGEVIVQSASEIDPPQPRGHVRAAVRIRAPAEAIWKVITDCRQTVAFVPGLKRCREVGRASDGRWEDIEQEVRYAWFLPTIRYVFRAMYDRPRRIELKLLSGDLKAEEGTWLLTPSPDGSATVVEYEMYIDPGFWIPQTIISRELRQDLPAALKGLRKRVEAMEPGALRSAGAARLSAGR